VLEGFLKWREGEDGDRSAANDIAPVVQFAIDLWGDPCLQDVGPDQIVQFKRAMLEIPTPEGIPANKRSLFQRWSMAKEFDYSIVDSEGKTVTLTRVDVSRQVRDVRNRPWQLLGIANADGYRVVECVVVPIHLGQRQRLMSAELKGATAGMADELQWARNALLPLISVRLVSSWRSWKKPVPIHGL
jgi:hypothetical protein